MKRLLETLESVPETALLLEVVRRLKKNYARGKGRDFLFGDINLVIHEGTLGRIEYLERYKYVPSKATLTIAMEAVK